jgi:putative ABC transport system ATP-binding protein
MPIIEIRELSREFQMGESVVHALRGVSLDVYPGEFVTLMGPSGCGKSTLMHLLGCLDTPTTGSYHLEGQNLSELSVNERALIRNRRIGFVFQTFNLLPRLTTYDNVALPLLYGKRGREIRQRVNDVLEQVGLSDRAKHRPTELSGGQRQRVAIARALITDPAIILADEPTGNLDSTTGAEIMGLFASLNHSGRTIILVTHNADVAAYAQRSLHMYDGCIVSS